MLIRILLLGFLIALGVMFWRKLTGNQPEKTATNDITRMCKCAHCGIHVPTREAIKSGEHFYCSDQHRLLHERNPDD